MRNWERERPSISGPIKAILQAVDGIIRGEIHCDDTLLSKIGDHFLLGIVGWPTVGIVGIDRLYIPLINTNFSEPRILTLEHHSTEMGRLHSHSNLRRNQEIRSRHITLLPPRS